MGGPLPVLDVLLCSIGLLGGLALIRLGLRGRTVGDHPHCRKCGFDLFGQPPGFTTCPECGVAVATAGELIAKTTRIGRRRWRRGPLAIGLALALPAVAWLAGASKWTDVNLNALTPAAALRWQADLPGPPGRSAAAELDRRLLAGSLPDATVDSIVADFLADQADLARPWLTGKGDFIQHAHAAGRVSVADWNRYGGQGMKLILTHRPVVRAGQPVPLVIASRPLRFGSSVTFNLRFCLTEDAGRPAAGPLVADCHTPLTGFLQGPQAGYSTSNWDGPAPPAATAGRTLTLRLDFDPVSPGPPTPPGPPRSPLPAGAVALGTVRVVAADQPAATAASDPAMAGIVRRTLRLKVLNPSDYRVGKSPVPEPAIGVELQYRLLTEIHGPGSPTDKYESLRLWFDRQTPNPWPLAGAWTAWVRTGGREFEAGRVALRPAGNILTSVSLGASGEPGHPASFEGVERVDVILRPDARAAEGTADILTFWDGEVKFNNVPLVRKKQD